LLNLVSEIGSVKTGLMLMFGLTLSSWQKYKHDQKLASSLLLERQKTNLIRSRKPNPKEMPVVREELQTKKLEVSKNSDWSIMNQVHGSE